MTTEPTASTLHSGLNSPKRAFLIISRGLSPQIGWASFVLVFLTVLSVVWSIEQAKWVETPSLAVIAFWGVTTGALLAKVRLPVLFLQPFALLAGAGVLAWHSTKLISGGSLGYRFDELRDRAEAWFTAASTNGISTDPIPFSFALMALSWLLGYLCAWFVFRNQNFWIPLILAGTGILINLSYLPAQNFGFFITYLILSMLLATMVHIRRREKRWTATGVTPIPYLAATNVHHAFWLATIAIVIAFLLPIREGSLPAFKRTYEFATMPLERYHGDFNRLFAGLPARKPLPYRTFDSTLPFQGTIRLSDEVIFSVETSHPSYLRVRSYPTYTSKGWVSANTQFVPMDWEPSFPLPTRYTFRDTVTHRVALNFRTITLMVPGPPTSSLIPLRIETPTSPSYTIRTSGVPVPASWPDDVQKLAKNIITRAGERPELTDTAVNKALPDSLRLREISKDESGSIVQVTVIRSLPVPVDVLSVRSPRHFFTGDSYTLSSSISTATGKELNLAGSKYPAWVTDIYLQLPDSLPERVVNLAIHLTDHVETPYAKAMAIQEYLRSFPYTLNVPAVPFDGDGVDHLLFNVRAGYSDYFGSAMTVLLRSIGIPSRMVVGYTPGQEQKDGSFLVRDRNSHGWTEAYFPEYGWIPFEPTPNREPIVHGERNTVEKKQFPDFAGQPFEEEEEETTGGMVFFGIGALGETGTASLIIGGFFVAIAIIITGTTGYFAFQWLLGLPRTPVSAYVKMTRLARIAGLGPRSGQTPREYGDNLSNRLGSNEAKIERIISEYERYCYGGHATGNIDTEQNLKAWRALCGALLARALRRRPS